MWATITSGNTWHGEVTNRRKDGSLYTEEMTITPVHSGSGEITHYVAIKQDVTSRKIAEDRLRQAEEKYRSIFEDAVIGIFQATPEGRPVSVNRALARMHGYDSPEQLMAEVSNVGRQLFVDPNALQEFGRVLEKDRAVHSVEFEIYRNDGSKKWISTNVRAVSDADGKVVLHEGTVEDITQRKAAEERVQFLAYYDALTGLPNRTLLRDRALMALPSARRHREKVALLFLGLDRFKTIDDSLGHSVGDLLLKEVALRLKGCTQENDTVARLGGDEFLVLVTGINETADAVVVAERIVQSMASEFVIQGHFLSVTCSMGISIFPDHGEEVEALLKNADLAMYKAKENGRNNFQLFTLEMNVQAVERMTLENGLRRALEREELFLVYQPQADLAAGKITGCEALVRWRHPELGLLSPDQFIPVAENSGLIMPIGEWVLKTACAQTRRWQNEGLPAVPVAVNVSAVQLHQKGFLPLINKVLGESGLAPQYLELEITESVLLSNADIMRSLLQELIEMGVKLTMDDFGTGYSSFTYLKYFRPYKVKIDHSFVQDVMTNADDAAITSTIIIMAKNLGFKVIAEGVENEEQMFFLRGHGCDEIQGYYLCQPLHAGEFAYKLRSLPLHFDTTLSRGGSIGRVAPQSAPIQVQRNISKAPDRHQADHERNAAVKAVRTD
jgi:diguanylate cyclase (GGDEF)-like protein/PAS domain S-box-containing protein